MSTKEPIFERFVRQFAPQEDGCWYWTSHIGTRGYGSFSIKRYPHLAHRVAYELFVGPIPPGLTLDHLCRIRHCVNPDHLEPVTRGENVMRGDTLPARNAARFECIRGHPLQGDNLYITPNGRRQCKECGRIRSKRSRARG